VINAGSGRRVPVVIVTGFLGSGKTTLLNHVLRSADLGRVAALVNDFGAVNIDAELIASVADEVVELTNGCVCCSINGDLYEAVKQALALDPPVERIVVETTGLADPLPVGLTFLETDLRSRTTLDAVVTVVDVANFPLDLFGSRTAMAQIVHGDVIVLNKCDLVTDDTTSSLERRIAIIKPKAKTWRATLGNVPACVMFDPVDRLRLADAGANARLAANEVGFQAQTFRFDRPFSSEQFRRWLDDGVPDQIYRAKGFIRFDKPPSVFLFQLCGARAAFNACDADVSGAELVFIGMDLRREALAERLAACVAP
jgi:G3E family GTPase